MRARAPKMSKVLKEAIEKDDLEAVKVELAKKQYQDPAVLNARCEYNKKLFTPLLYAVEKKSAKVFEFLVDYKEIDVHAFVITTAGEIHSRNGYKCDAFTKLVTEVKISDYVINVTRKLFNSGYKLDSATLQACKVLVKFAQANCPDLIEKLLEYDAFKEDPKKNYTLEDYPLCVAIEAGQEANAKLLVTHPSMSAQHLAASLKASINKENLSMMAEIMGHSLFDITLAPFFEKAIAKANTTIIKKLVTHPAHPRDWLGNTDSPVLTWNYLAKTKTLLPFQILVAILDLPSVQFQIVKHENKNTVTRQLKVAVDETEVKALLSTFPEFDINTVLWNGLTLLSDAVKTDAIQTTVVLFANPTLQPNLADNNGNTAFLLATKFNPALISTFLNRNDIDLYAQNNAGHTAVTLAFKHGHSEAGMAILNHPKFDICQLYNDQQNLLMLACQFELEELVDHLLSLKLIPIDVGDENGRTAFIIAAETHDNHNIIRSLTTANANPHLLDQKGNSPLILADRFQHRGIRSLIKEAMKKTPVPECLKAPVTLFADTKPKQQPELSATALADLTARLGDK